MKFKHIILVCFLVVVSGPVAYAQSTNGAFSAYLVGMYERRANIGTIIEVINPTTSDLKVVAAFYDDNEQYVTCLLGDLTPNDLIEVPVFKLPLQPRYGVIKILSYGTDGGQPQPVRGIVGYQRHCVSGVGCTESNLAGIPMDIAQAEVIKIAEQCEGM